MTYDEISAALHAVGLEPRGGFQVTPGDAAPSMPDGRMPRSLVLAGNVGDSIWQAFAESLEFRAAQHPLDAWTRRVLDDVATRVGAVALYPFDGPPFLPFQRWAQRAEPAFASPLGLLIHADYGLWHAYRGALLFADPIDVPAIVPIASPCASCADKPCLADCPVGAFDGRRYAVDNCVAHLSTPRSPCMDRGCGARLACPVGPEFRYGAPMQQFLMRAFRRAQTGS